MYLRPWRADPHKNRSIKLIDLRFNDGDAICYNIYVYSRTSRYMHITVKVWRCAMGVFRQPRKIKKNGRTYI